LGYKRRYIGKERKEKESEKYGILVVNDKAQVLLPPLWLSILRFHFGFLKTMIEF
jgi:hypothetical protein